MFNAELVKDERTGKNFEFSGSLFIPLPGEFKEERPLNPVCVAKEEKTLFVPASAAVHFQKDFSKTVKMDPLFGERIRAREDSSSSTRTVFRMHARSREETPS